MIFTHTLPIFVLLFFITVVVVPEVNDTKGTCYILHQSIVCNSVNVTHLDSVKEILDNASSEYPNFGFICNHCNLQGFPDDILKDFNITTFGFIPHEVQPDSFPYLDILKNINSKLTHLYLLGGSVTSSDFQKLKEFHFGDTLKFLDLRYNKLDAIDSETFAGWNQLEEINLLGNKISNVRRHAFKGLDNLRKVDLSKNIITLEDEAFYELPSLTHLDFSSANISVIPKRAFVNLKSLKSLILQFNGISTVEKETFNTENFPNISELNLTGKDFWEVMIS